MSVTLIIGLGNPGERYQNTRHNVGFKVVDALAGFFQVPWKRSLFSRSYAATTQYMGQRVICIKPTTYMNRSGEILPGLLRKYPEARLIIVTDNMDIQPGHIRIKRGGSAGGHNGVSSILQYAKDRPLLKIYVGIGRPQREPPKSYVLHEAKGDESIDLSWGITHAKDAVLKLLSASVHESLVEEVMHEYNKKQG